MSLQLSALFLLIAINHHLLQLNGQLIDCNNQDGPDDITLNNCRNQYLILKGGNITRTRVKLRGTGSRLPVTSDQDDVLPSMTFDAITQSRLAVGSVTYLFRTNANGSVAMCTIAPDPQNPCLITANTDCTATVFPALAALQGNHKVEAATWTPNGFLFIMTDTSSSTMFQMVTNLTGNMLSRSNIANGTLSPTAVSHVRTTGLTTDLLVFYNDIVAVQQATLGNFAQAITVNRQLDYQHSKAWLGCSPEFCFDGNIDAASAHPQGGLALLRGRYMVRLPQVGNPLPSPTELPAAMRHADAAFLIDGQIVVTKGQNYVQNGTNFNFPALSTPLDAAALATVRIGAGMQSVLAIALNSTLSAFVRTINDFTRIQDLRLPPGVPVPVDGVAAISAGSTVPQFIFIKDNFFVQVDAVFPPRRNQQIPAPRLLQGNLFQCPVTYYQSSAAAQKLGIASAADFAAYRNQFAPSSPIVPTRRVRPTIPVPTLPDGQTPGPRPSPRTQTTINGAPGAMKVNSVLVFGALVSLLLVSRH